MRPALKAGAMGFWAGVFVFLLSSLGWAHSAGILADGMTLKNPDSLKENSRGPMLLAGGGGHFHHRGSGFGFHLGRGLHSNHFSHGRQGFFGHRHRHGLNRGHELIFGIHSGRIHSGQEREDFIIHDHALHRHFGRGVLSRRGLGSGRFSRDLGPPGWTEDLGPPHATGDFVP